MQRINKIVRLEEFFLTDSRLCSTTALITRKKNHVKSLCYRVSGPSIEDTLYFFSPFDLPDEELRAVAEKRIESMYKDPAYELVNEV